MVNLDNEVEIRSVFRYSFRFPSVKFVAWSVLKGIFKAHETSQDFLNYELMKFFTQSSILNKHPQS